jgi:hypothetical protein
VNPERIRFIAYFFFWTMAGFAMVVTEIYVVPILAAGAKPDTPIERLGCGPFDRDRDGLTYGSGFDFHDQNHLKEKFGFANICTFWDYHPARELVGMYFPFFEYTLVIYLVLDYIVMKISRSRGEIPQWYMNVVTVVTPLCIFLAIQFRMIFVAIAYESVQHHTQGFLGLQIAVLLVAVMNVSYIILTKQDCPSFSISYQQFSKIALVYLVINGFISAIKIYGTAFVAFGDGSPPAYFHTLIFTGWPLGKIIDKFWMIMNAILPPIIAYVRSVDEEEVIVTVSQPKHVYRSETTGEAAQLLQQS